MVHDKDVFQEAFEALATDVSSNIDFNPSLEMRLMTEAKNRNQRSIKMKTVVAAVAVLFVVGGTTAWAAGGVDAIRSWFGTAVLIDTNGTQTELEITPEGVISVGPTSFLMIEDPATLVEGQEISIFTDPPADGLHESQSE